ncbi:MAG: ABC transporter permease [Candidatus Bathyarchaeota archaeon]|nr:ABC transporter permease [Candidatus Bathyarchaeota archaeon]
MDSNDGNPKRHEKHVFSLMVAFVLVLVFLLSTSTCSAASLTSLQYSAEVSDNAFVSMAASTEPLVEIDCSLTPTFNGSMFRSLPDLGDSPFNESFTPGQLGGFDPEEFFNGTDPSGFGGNLIGAQSALFMDESSYSDISSIRGVVAVAPILQVTENQNSGMSMTGQNFSQFLSNYIIMGIPLSSQIIASCPILPSNITTGRNLQSSDVGVVVISESSSAYFGAGVGDQITLFGQSFEVVGVYVGSGLIDSQAVYMSLSDAQTLTGNVGNVSRLKAFAYSADASSVVDAIKTLHPELFVVTAQNSGAPQFPVGSMSPFPAVSSSPSTQQDETESSPSSLLYVGVAVAVTVLALLVVLLMVRKRRSTNAPDVGVLGDSVRFYACPSSQFFWYEFRANLGVNLENHLIVNSLVKLKN